MSAAPPCPLCNGTGRRRIRIPNTRRRATLTLPCDCALTKDNKHE